MTDQLDTNRTDLLNVFADIWDTDYPHGLFDGEYEDFDTTWSFTVSEGVGILRVVLEAVGEKPEEFEWELNLRG
jgi:hypothetical protein